MINKIREILDSCPKDRTKCSIKQLIDMLDSIDKEIENQEINEMLLKEADKFLADIDNIRKNCSTQEEGIMKVTEYVNAYNMAHKPTTEDILNHLTKRINEHD